MYLAVLTNPRQRDTYIEPATTGFIQFPPSLFPPPFHPRHEPWMVGTCRDASNLKGGLNFPREIPRSLNFAPQFDPSFFPRFEETPAFSKPRRISLVHQKKGKEREKFAAGCFFFSFLIVILYQIYVYMCVYVFYFYRKFPNFRVYFNFWKRARANASARVICSINALHYDANKRIPTRWIENYAKVV